MPIDASEPQSPGWWLNRLERKLIERRPSYELLNAYYDGAVACPTPTNKTLTESYARLMAFARTNFAELVVEAVRERMRPVGFRTGATDDDAGDAEAWRIWQANHLDAEAPVLAAAQLSMGMALVMVGEVDEETGVPVITVEDPREVIVETDPLNRWRSIAGLKIWRDDVYGVDRARLCIPGEVWSAVRNAPTDGMDTQGVGGWEWDGDPRPLPPGLERLVPIVPFPNRPKTRGGARGEFQTHLPILDRINYTVLQRVEIATLQAHRQRALKGGPTHDEHGNEIDYSDIFSMDPGAIWHLPETAELWESQPFDLGPIRLAVRDDVLDLAAVTRTPLFYLTPDATNGSAEGASLAREGLIFKVLDRITEATEAWEQVMSLAFRMAGDHERANRVAMEVLWQSPERRSIEARADAGSKAIQGGLTLRQVRQRIWDMTPQEIEEAEADDVADALRSMGATLTAAALNATDPTGQRPAR